MAFRSLPVTALALLVACLCECDGNPLVEVFRDIIIFCTKDGQGQSTSINGRCFCRSEKTNAKISTDIPATDEPETKFKIDFNYDCKHLRTAFQRGGAMYELALTFNSCKYGDVVVTPADRQKPIEGGKYVLHCTTSTVEIWKKPSQETTAKKN